MARQNEKLEGLLRAVLASGKRESDALVGEQLAEAGLLDRAILNEQISAILFGAVANPSLGRIMEQHLEAFQDFVREGSVAGAANEVCALLSLENNDLRRAALLSLMVRLAGKRKFDPIASYILDNKAARGTGRS